MRLKKSIIWLLVTFCLAIGIMDLFVKFASQIDDFTETDVKASNQWAPINVSFFRTAIKSDRGLKQRSSNLNDNEDLQEQFSEQLRKIKKRSIFDQREPLFRRLGNRTRPVDHIAFLKVHMAGSTPLQTMFFRYGYERNLSFVLPSKGHYFTKSTSRPEPILPPKHGTHFDIVCNHACFNYSLYSSLMPSDTVYIAIVRDPYKQFLYSYYYYLRFFSFSYLTHIPYPPIENLIMYPDKYDEGCLSYTMNAIARDFGFEKNHFYDYSPGSYGSSAQAYLENIAKVFDLVLVFEKYEESLILMKRLLKWPLKNILFVPEKEDVSEMPLSAPLLKQFKNRNRLDYLVYDYFAKLIDEKIREAGEDLEEETSNYKMALKTVRMWCDYQYFGTLTIPATKWNERLTVTSSDCEQMGKSEFAFMDILKDDVTN